MGHRRMEEAVVEVAVVEVAVVEVCIQGGDGNARLCIISILGYRLSQRDDHNC